MIPASLYAIENRGYGRATGTLLLPDGGQLQVSDETPELNNVLAVNVWNEWTLLKEALG